MSLDVAVARMQEIQRMLQPPAAPAPPAQNAPGAGRFATALAGASATAATAAAPAPGAVPVAASTGDLAGVPYGEQIAAAARRHGVDPALLAGLVRQESGFDPSAMSPAGARGLTQLMPGTAASVGVTDATDPTQALDGGARYLKQQLDAFGGDVTKALAAYNAGPGAVQRHGGVPPYAETRAYVQKVQAFADEYRAAAPAPPAAPVASAGALPVSRPVPAGLPYSTV